MQRDKSMRLKSRRVKHGAESNYGIICQFIAVNKRGKEGEREAQTSGPSQKTVLTDYEEFFKPIEYKQIDPTISIF